MLGKKKMVKYIKVYFTSSSKSNSSSPIEKKDDILKQRTVAISSVIFQLIQEQQAKQELYTHSWESVNV